MRNYEDFDNSDDFWKKATEDDYCFELMQTITDCFLACNTKWMRTKQCFRKLFSPAFNHPETGNQKDFSQKLEYLVNEYISDTELLLDQLKEPGEEAIYTVSYQHKKDHFFQSLPGYFYNFKNAFNADIPPYNDQPFFDGYKIITKTYKEPFSQYDERIINCTFDYKGNFCNATCHCIELDQNDLEMAFYYLDSMANIVIAKNDNYPSQG